MRDGRRNRSPNLAVVWVTHLIRVIRHDAGDPARREITPQICSVNEVLNKCRLTRISHAGREQPPVVPTTGAIDAPIPTNEDATKVRLGSRQRPQPLQHRTPPRRSNQLQAFPLSRPARVAGAHELDLRHQSPGPANQRIARFNLTARPTTLVPINPNWINP